MARNSSYKGSVVLPAGLLPKNNANFPLVDAHEVQVEEDGTRLDDKIDSLDSKTTFAASITNENKNSTTVAPSIKAVNDAIADIDVDIDVDTELNASSTNPVQNKVVTQALSGIQNTLQYDTTPTANSDKLIKSGNIKTALDAKQDTLTFDNAPTSSSTNPVTSGGVKTALDAKQDTLNFDSSPTADSINPVTSGGVKAALDTKQNTLSFDTAPVTGSVHPVTSVGIKNAIDAAANANLGAMQAQYDTFVANAEDVLDNAASLSNGMVACNNIAAETTPGDTRLLIYTGTTNATYTNGHWYYNSAASNVAPVWTDGGAVGTAPTIDNTLSVSGAAAESSAVGDAIDDIVIVSDTEPSATGNKVWIKETTDEEVVVPLFEEHIAKANKADITTNNEDDLTSASKAYAIGDHFYINDTNVNSQTYGASTLYKATAAIAAGDPITVGTNCIAVQLADEVTELSNDNVDMNVKVNNLKDAINDKIIEFNAELEIGEINDNNGTNNNTYPKRLRLKEIIYFDYDTLIEYTGDITIFCKIHLYNSNNISDYKERYTMFSNFFIIPAKSYARIVLKKSAEDDDPLVIDNSEIKFKYLINKNKIKFNYKGVYNYPTATYNITPNYIGTYFFKCKTDVLINLDMDEYFICANAVKTSNPQSTDDNISTTSWVRTNRLIMNKEYYNNIVFKKKDNTKLSYEDINLFFNSIIFTDQVNRDYYGAYIGDNLAASYYDAEHTLIIDNELHIHANSKNIVAINYNKFIEALENIDDAPISINKIDENNQYGCKIKLTNISLPLLGFYLDLNNNKILLTKNQYQTDSRYLFLFGFTYQNLLLGVLKDLYKFKIFNSMITEPEQTKKIYEVAPIYNIQESAYLEFEYGTLYYSHPTYNTNRIRTKECIKLDYDITIFMNNKDMHFAVAYYNDDNSETGTDSGWINNNQEFTIRAGVNFKLLFAKVTNEVNIRNDFNQILQYAFVKVPHLMQSTNTTTNTITMPFIEEIHQGISETGIPFNTFYAIKNAMDNGFRCVEIDIRKSSDGELVIWHDPTVNGILNGEETTLTIANETYDTLSQLVLSTHTTLGDQHLYKFNDCIDYLWKHGSYVNLDLKINNFEEVATVIRNKNMCGKGFYFNFTNTIENMNKVLAIDPLAKFGFSYSLSKLEELYNANFDMDKIIVWQYASAATQESVNAIKSYKCKLLIAGVNASSMEQAYSYHPDIIEYSSMTLQNVLAAKNIFLQSL